MTLLFIYALCTFTVSFVTSLAEAAILSISPAHVSLLEKRGRRSGRLLHGLRSQVDKPLAAILTFNTMSNTIGSMLIGKEVIRIYGDESFGMMSAVVTFVVLIFAEIVPKSIGARYAKPLAPLLSYVITGMVAVTLPIVYISRFINYVFMGKAMPSTTREEMIATAEIGADEGVLHAKEMRIIRNLLMLDEIKVSEIMTPRSVVNSFDATETVDAIMNKYKPVRFSRIPLFEGTANNIVGLLHRYKLMEAVSHDMYNMPLRDIMTSVHRVPENLPVSAALDQFIKRREHLFLVDDKKGVMSGIVTLEDAIETLLGVEIVDEYDTITDMRQYALEQWRLKKQALIKKI